MVLDTALFNTQQYEVRIKGKVEQSRERSSALPTPRCCSYRKGSLLLTLDYGRQLTREWSSALSNTSVLKLLKREPSGHSRLRSLTSLHFTVKTSWSKLRRTREPFEFEKKNPSKTGIWLIYDTVNTQTFTSEWSTSAAVLLTIDIHRVL